MELCRFYSLYDTHDNNVVVKKLGKMKNECKIDFEYEEFDELIRIRDLDLEEHEVDNLLKYFEKHNVVPYLERDGDDEDGEIYFDEDYFDNDEDF